MYKHFYFAIIPVFTRNSQLLSLYKTNSSMQASLLDHALVKWLKRRLLVVADTKFAKSHGGF